MDWFESQKVKTFRDFLWFISIFGILNDFVWSKALPGVSLLSFLWTLKRKRALRCCDYYSVHRNWLWPIVVCAQLSRQDWKRHHCAILVLPVNLHQWVSRPDHGRWFLLIQVNLLLKTLLDILRTCSNTLNKWCKIHFCQCNEIHINLLVLHLQWIPS